MGLVRSGEFAREIRQVREGEFAGVGPVAYTKKAEVALNQITGDKALA